MRSFKSNNRRCISAIKFSEEDSNIQNAGNDTFVSHKTLLKKFAEVVEIYTILLLFNNNKKHEIIKHINFTRVFK